MSLAFDSPAFRQSLAQLLVWRRDVRRFRTDPVDEALIETLLEAAACAPSVGLSQPWRFVRVRSHGAREAVKRNFETCNAQALKGYEGADAALYAELKLSGLDAAPVQFAVFCDHGSTTGRGLGRATMPETLDYSVVTAVHSLWLAARAHGLGVGWVSILDPDQICAALSVPGDWKLISYLCLGFAQSVSPEPELERQGWEKRIAIKTFILDR